MKSEKLTKTICFIFAVVFLLTAFVGSVLAIQNAVRQDTSAQTFYSSAKAMCLMESGSGRVLASKNKDQSLAMASTTKILTAITAIENAKDLDEVFEISPKAVGVPGTSIYLRKGEKMTLRQLLYGLMLVSGNDASVAIGEKVGGNVNNFVDMMNKTALKIGATNTHFDNTHGLDSKTHYTSAYDLALITSYALKNQLFKEIVSTKNIKIVSDQGKTRYLKNKNRLLNSFVGCNGVKTGFTDDAGRCLVSSAERDGMQVVCVVLNCGPMFEECSTLMEQAFATYRLYDLTSNYAFPRQIQVEEGEKDYVHVDSKEKFLYPLAQGELDKISYKYELAESVSAPVQKDSEVGKVQVYFDNDLLFEEKIFTIESVRGNTIWQKLKKLFGIW